MDNTHNVGFVRQFSRQCGGHLNISCVLQDMTGSCSCSHSITRIIGCLGEFVIRNEVLSECRQLVQRVTRVVQKSIVPSLIEPLSIVLRSFSVQRARVYKGCKGRDFVCVFNLCLYNEHWQRNRRRPTHCRGFLREVYPFGVRS